MNKPNDWKPQEDTWHGCQHVPEFDRLHYYYGQMLGPRDFQTEQDFFRNKQKMLNRCLHGYGVVCGLEVTDASARPQGVAGKVHPKSEMSFDQEQLAERPDEGELPHEGRPPEKGHAPFFLDIGCGMALDAAGNELVVRERRPWEEPPLCPPYLDVWEILKRQETKETLAKLRESGAPIYISLHYQEQKHAPQRIADSPCETVCSNYETYAKIRDSVCVRIDLHEPPADPRCGPCCEEYPNPGVLLAKIVHPFHPRRRDILNEVRRPLGLYVPTTITDVNWDHGGVYRKQEVENFIRRRGLLVRFSRPVLTSTIKAGVIDVWTTNDWGFANRSGDFECLPVEFDLNPEERTTSELRFKVREDLGSDDRVLIIIRTDFLLDECYRPVDGNHLGGLVPRLGDSKFPQPVNRDHIPDVGDPAKAEDAEARCCRYSRTLHGPWHSGNGTPGGTFESWFFTVRDENAQKGPTS